MLLISYVSFLKLLSAREDPQCIERPPSFSLNRKVFLPISSFPAGHSETISHTVALIDSLASVF